MKKEKNLKSIFKTKSENYKSDVRPKLWDKLEKRMDDHYATTPPLKMVSHAWMRYAAALILLLGATFLLTQVQDKETALTAHQFYIVELSSVDEEVKIYEDMVHFSQQHYQTLINPTKKTSKSL